MDDLPSLDQLVVLERHELETVFVDGVITSGSHGGVVNITLGTFVYPPVGIASVQPAARIRMSAEAARIIGESLFAQAAASTAEPEGPPANRKLN